MSFGRNGCSHFPCGLDGGLTLGGFAGEFGAGILKETVFVSPKVEPAVAPGRVMPATASLAPKPSRVNQPPTANDSISLAASKPDKTASDLSFPNFQQQRIRRLAGPVIPRKHETARDVQFFVRLASDQAIEFRAKKISSHISLGGLPEERQSRSFENAPFDECLHTCRGTFFKHLTSVEMRDAKSLAVEALSVAA